MSHAAKVAPFTLLELAVKRATASVLSKPQWWLKWRELEIRDRWLREIQHEFLRKTLTQSLKWEPYEFSTLRDLERIAESPERETLVAQWLEHVRFDLNYRLSGVGEGEEEEENDDDFQKERNAYTFVLWYFTYAALREKLLAIPPGLWSYETFRPAIVEAEQRSDPSVLPRTLDFLQAVLENSASEESVRDALQGAGTRADAIEVLRGKCAEIGAELSHVRSFITQALDQIAQSDDFHVEIFPTEERVPVTPIGIHGAWICDSLVPEALKTKFVQEIAVLENVPDEAKDWHPKTNQQVLDLVHPSLYCCVLGKTKQVVAHPPPETYTTAAEHMHKILGTASKVVENEFKGQSGRTSTFQWIPSDIQVNEDGSARIVSYINNLHPVHFASLYISIESIFARFVPLFERVVSAAKDEFPGPVLEPPEDYNAGRPDISETFVPEISSVPDSLRGKTLQVIVKAAEILLTPDSPTYAGGSWHIEGTDTEQIVATGIYYFGCDNIKDSRLSFRVNVEEPMYEQSDDSGVAVMYGLFNEDLLVQTLGSVATTEDRCLVFPNVLQHKVEPFELEDPAKPGSRKILAFFLIDPETQIPSSSSIPPQQREWIDEVQGPLLRKLQLFEFAEETVKQMANGNSMTLDEAKRYRLELMTERSALADPDPDDYESYFSLCEH
ncbi:hypothetical protein Gpo141_00009826 [Globisporangium polare]